MSCASTIRILIYRRLVWSFQFDPEFSDDYSFEVSIAHLANFISVFKNGDFHFEY